jgi:hypothetical protein
MDLWVSCAGRQLAELPQLIVWKKINHVVIVSELLPEIRVAIQEIATRAASS